MTLDRYQKALDKDGNSWQIVGESDTHEFIANANEFQITTLGSVRTNRLLYLSYFMTRRGNLFDECSLLPSNATFSERVVGLAISD
jgi:hypothetical protein